MLKLNHQIQKTQNFIRKKIEAKDDQIKKYIK